MVQTKYGLVSHQPQVRSEAAVRCPSERLLIWPPLQLLPSLLCLHRRNAASGPHKHALLNIARACTSHLAPSTSLEKPSLRPAESADQNYRQELACGPSLNIKTASLVVRHIPLAMTSVTRV